MSFMAVFFTFAAMAIFSGLLIVAATARSSQLANAHKHERYNLQDAIDEPYVAPSVIASTSSTLGLRTN